MARRTKSGSLLSGGNLRALSSMFLRPRVGEGVFNLEVFNGMAVAQDLGQQRPQLGDVPLTVAQVVDEAALRLFFRGMKVPVEGGVGRANPQALVENHEWLSQGRNDVLGVGEGVLHLMLLPPAFADVSEHKYDPGDCPLVVAHWGGTVVDGSFRAVLSDEQAVVRKPDHHAVPQGSDGGTFDRLVALFVDDAEHAVQRLARCFRLRPARQGRSDRVEERDPPLDVGGNHRIGNAGEGDVPPLRLEVRCFVACQ